MCFKTTFVRIDSQIAFASLFRWHLKKWNITFVCDGCSKGDPCADSMGFSALHWIPQFLPWNLFTKKTCNFFPLNSKFWLEVRDWNCTSFQLHISLTSYGCKFLFLSTIEGWIIGPATLPQSKALLWSSSMARSSTICKKTGGNLHDEMDKNHPPLQLASSFQWNWWVSGEAISTAMALARRHCSSCQ